MSKKFDKLVQTAMEEVHKNVPHNVIASGKTGAEKEKMLEAIAFSKARRGKGRKK